MRTTLEIDDGVLTLVRERAARDGVSVGQALSDLALMGLQASRAPRARSFPTFSPPPERARHIVTPELVKRYQDDDQ